MRRVRLMEELRDMASESFWGGRGSYLIYEKKNTVGSQALFKRDRIGLEFSSVYSVFLLEACSLPGSIIPWIWNGVFAYGAYCIQYWLQSVKSWWQKKNVCVKVNMQCAEKPFMDLGINQLLSVKWTLFINVPQSQTRNSVEIGFFINYLILLLYVYYTQCYVVCDCTGYM